MSNCDLDLRLGLGGRKLWWGGVDWDAVLDSYTRTGMLAGESLGVSPGNTKLPIHSLMRRCLLEDDGTVNYYLDGSDSTLKMDGTASDLTSGSDGQVMVEIRGPIYYAITFNGDTRSFSLANFPKSGYTLHPAFTNSSLCYVGAYEGSMYDATAGAMVDPADVATSLYAAGDIMCSLSGEYPKTNETRDENRGMAAQRGSGWHQYDNVFHSLISMLYLVEYADFNAQSTIGDGRTGLSGGTWTAGSYIGQCGLSNSDGNGTNSVSNGGASYATDYMTYRGVENWWGNVWKNMDGVNIHNASGTGSRLWLATDPSVYADDTETGYTMSGQLAEADGYGTDVVDAMGIWPTSVGGSSSTYLTDSYSTYYDDDNESGWRVVLVGGRAAAGSAAGPFYVYADSGSSTAYSTIGGRICYRKP